MNQRFSLQRGFGRVFRGETDINFIGHARRWFTISGVVILLGLASLLIRGLNFGIDFKGGVSWEVPSASLSVGQARAAISPFGLSSATVVTLGGGGGRTVQVQADLNTLSQTAKTAKEQAVSDALAKAAHVSSNQVSLTDVGPTWGGEITSKAIRALIFFFLAIAVYISLRFEPKMAIAALLAVVHDILVTIGIYSLSGFQVTPSTVIAVLTILGYSLYDTIVVFDRVKENITNMVHVGRRTYSDGVNDSVNQVLARSINTSTVAIIPILSVLVVGAYILGATTLKDFGLALFIGLTTGAYSSIFIASPILAWIKEREPRYKVLRQNIGSAQAKASRNSKFPNVTAKAATTAESIESKVAPELTPVASGSKSRLVNVDSLHGSNRPSSRNKSKGRRR
ncbi:MAG: protein translocase subunit SecF [Acidimicrobiaceae bacterium]|nr:protein translocase subunit SecF [Acidimicrobiaceae bacterium]